MGVRVAELVTISVLGKISFQSHQMLVIGVLVLLGEQIV